MPPVGLVQQLLVNDELVQGRLVHILPNYEVKPTEALLTYLSVRFLRPVIRAFIASPFPALRTVDGIVSAGGDHSIEEYLQMSGA